MVLPYFNYCSTIWHDNNISHINNLFKLQKRAARVITSSDYSIRSVQIFETLQWQSIKTILDKRELIMMFKVLNGMAPNYLTMLFHKRNNTANYHLRTHNLKKIGTQRVHVSAKKLDSHFVFEDDMGQ